MIKFTYRAVEHNVNIEGLFVPENPKNPIISTTIPFAYPAKASGFVDIMKMIENRMKKTYPKKHTITFDSSKLIILTEECPTSDEELLIKNLFSRMCNKNGAGYFFRHIEISLFKNHYFQRVLNKKRA